MSQFTPDPQLFSKPITGYTSDDEFSFDRRIQITNEVPTLDPFENLHSVMQNDVWKWMIGSNQIMFDVPFNLDTDGWELKDGQNRIVAHSISKYVNGMRVRDYGDYPSVIRSVYSSYGGGFWYIQDGVLRVRIGDEVHEVTDGTLWVDGGSYGVKSVLDEWDRRDDYFLQAVHEIPVGVRYEVNGAVLPEMDLLLHEGYRYLHSQYPDHPRWADLLTDNEIDDQIVDAGAIVGYVPNVKLFRMITAGLDYGDLPGEDLYRAESYEATKLLVRNLLDDSRRKKFYGGKIGYTMFVNDMLFQSRIYGVSRYRTYGEFEKVQGLPHPETVVDEHEEMDQSGEIVTRRGDPEFPHRRTLWFMKIFPMGREEFRDRSVNWFSRNWNRPFKLIDWRNSSYDYDVPGYVPDLATGISNPYDPLGLWEVVDDWFGPARTDRNGSTSFSDFYPGQWVMINNDPDDSPSSGVRTMIQRMDSYPKYERVFSDLSGEWTFHDRGGPDVIRLLLSTPIEPVYSSLLVYPSVVSAIEKIINDKTLTDGSQLLIDIADSVDDGKVLRSMELIFGSVKKPDVFDFLMDPVHSGALLMPFNVSILMYPDTVNARVRGSSFNPSIEDTPDSIHKKWQFVPGTMISQRKFGEPGNEVLRVTKTTKGSMTLSRFEGDGFFQGDSAEVTSERETAFEMITQNGTVFLFGIPSYVRTSVTDPNGRLYVNSAEVRITSIPLVKDRWMMQRCYPLFLQRTGEKLSHLGTIFGDSPPARSAYDTFVKTSKNLESTFDAYLSLTLSFVEDPPTSNRDERVIAHTAAYKEWIKALPTDKKKSVGEKFYEDWTNVRDFREPSPPAGSEKEFARVSRILAEKTTSVQVQSMEDISVECVLDDDRKYYDLKSEDLTDVQRVALKRIVDIDGNFDSWRANRWLLLSPRPNSPWETSPDISGSRLQSFTEEGTKINAVYKIVPSPLFAEDLDYLVREEIGFGYLSDWRDGRLNAVQVVSDGGLVTDFRLSKDKPGLIQSSTVDPYVDYVHHGSSFDVPYFDLRSDLQDFISSLGLHDSGLCAREDSWWTGLTGAGYKANNVTSVEDRTYEVKINVTIDSSSDPNLMTVTDEANRLLLATLNSGDQVYPDVFSAPGNMVETVDWDQGTIRTTESLLMDGMFSVKFVTRMNVVMDVSSNDDFWRYRYDLQKNGLLDPGDPWDHGFYPSKDWPDATSGVLIDSPVDLKYFKEELVGRLGDGSKFRSGFNDVVRLNYQRSLGTYVLPSLIDDSGELYWEYVPTKVLGYDEGKDDGKLIPVELHDHLDDNVPNVARACDLVNVGTNISMQTDNSGRFTPFPGKRWTDDSIHLRFKTIGWTEDTIPYFIEVGTGRLPLFDEELSGGAPNMNDYSGTRSYYEGGIDERAVKEERGDVYGGLGEQGWEGGFYTGDDIYKGLEKDYGAYNINHIDVPVFESPIGEYELRRFIQVDRDPGVPYTLIHTSVIKQEFEDLKRQSEIVMNFEKTFDLDVLADFSVGMFKDSETEIVLIDPVTDVKNIVFDGEYIPTSKQCPNGNYRVEWPAAREVDDEMIHYLVVRKDSVLTNVYDPQSGPDPLYGDGKFHTFSFPCMGVIVWEWSSPTTGKWVQKEFMFGGIYGSQSVLKSTLIEGYEGQEIEDPVLGTTYMPGKDSENNRPDHKDPLSLGDAGYPNLKHRLLIKLLGQLSFLSGSSVLARTFPVTDIEKILRAMYDYSIDPSVIPDVEAWVSTEIDNHDYDYLIPRNWGSIARIDPEFVRGPQEVLDLNRIYWFISGPVNSSSATGWNAMDNVGLGPGALYCVMYDWKSSKFNVHRINHSSKWSYLLNTEHLEGMDGSEWLTFCGENGITLPNGSPWLPLDRKEVIFTSIQMERTRILPGSFKLKLRIDPDFTSDGWRYSDYVENGPEGARLIREGIVASETPIYVDGENKVLYVYNRRDPESEDPAVTPVENDKYVLKIRENRFFKNALFVVGNYSLDEVEVDGVVRRIPRIHAMDGISFDVDFLSPIDRLLRFNSIRIRSNYARPLEADLFSSYVRTEGVFRGIYSDGDPSDVANLYVMIGFREARAAERISNRIESATEFKKLMPVDGRGKTFSDTDIDFDDARWPGSIDLIEKPLITSFDVRRRISTENSELTFTYYRNTLILEGILNTSLPFRIDFSENERLGDALDFILVGDRVVNVAAIDFSKYSQVSQFVFTATDYFGKSGDSSSVERVSVGSGGFDVVRVDFREGWILGATDDGWVLAKRIGSLLTSNSEIGSVAYKVGSSVSSLTGMAFDERSHSWIFTYTGSDPTVRSLTLDEDPALTRIQDIGDNRGFDVNTYQPVSIVDVDARGQTDLLDRNDYARVLARDVAWTAVDLNPIVEKNLLEGISSGTDPGLSKEFISISGSGIVDKILSPSAGSYSELDFWLRSTSSNGPLTMGIVGPPSIIPEVFWFDRTLNEWVKSRAKPGSVGTQTLRPILSKFNSTDTVRVKAYISHVDHWSTENGSDILEGMTPSGNISPAKPPIPPSEIPTIKMEGLKIEDHRESSGYPPPRTPYGSKNLRIHKDHPIYDYIRDVIRPEFDNTNSNFQKSNKKASNPQYLDDPSSANNPLYVDDGKSWMRYTVMEDVFVDENSPTLSGTDSGKNLYLKEIKKVVDPTGASLEFEYKKGKVVAVDFFDKVNLPYVWEVAWWCLTNDCAPPKDWTNDYGLRAYVEVPPVSPNDEVIYQFGFDPSGNVIGMESDGVNFQSIPIEANKNMELDVFCLRKNSETRRPPWDLQDREWGHVEIPLEYQNIYVDSDTGLPSAHRFFTELLIYTVYYQDYVSEYNSYIASRDFRNYIDLLRSQWKYLGEQSSDMIVISNPSISQYKIERGSTGVISGGIGRGFLNMEILESIPVWLKRIPPPSSLSGIEVAAVGLPGGGATAQLRLGYSIEGSGSFSLIGLTEKSPPSILTNDNGVRDELALTRSNGLYNPYSVGFISPEPLAPLTSGALSGARHACHNEDGNIAVVIGDQLFFYGKTRTYSKSGTDLTVTKNFHWKRASLPHRRHVEFNLLENMDLLDAITYVVQIRAQWIRLVENLLAPNSIISAPSGLSIEVLKKVYEWVLNNPIQGYDGDLTGTGSGLTIGNWSGIRYTDVGQIPTTISMSKPIDPNKTAADGGGLKVTFVETEGGVIPMFGDPDGGAEDHMFISREADGTGHLNKQNFYQYLLYYSTYILGNERFENLIDDGIKKMFMSSQYLCILTSKDDLLTLPLAHTISRDQIEDYSNWTVSNIDPKYLITSIEGTSTMRKKLVMDGQSHEFGLWPTEVTSKGFHINQVECIDNAVVVAGYVQANDLIQQMANEQTSYSDLNDLYPNDSWRTFKIDPDGSNSRYPKYPVIFYSNDGGKSFSKCELPTVEFIPSIKSYNGEYTDPAGSVIQATNQSDVESFSIHEHGNEIHVWFKNSDPGTNLPDPSHWSKTDGGVDDGNADGLNYSPLGYTTFEVSSFGTAIELNWLRNITRVTKKTESQMRLITSSRDPLNDIDPVDVQTALAGDYLSGDRYMSEDFYELKLSKTRSITSYGQSNMSPIGGMKFIMQQPFMFKANDIQITKIQDQMIEVTPPDESVPRWQAEDIRVLVSVVPSRSVMDQAKYLEAKSEYLDWTGKFIVDECVSVEDAVLANRMYSPREELEVRAPGQTTTPNREILPKRGIPAISEDVEHGIYEYMDPYIDKNGDEVWDYVPAVNGQGHGIMLINSEGNYLLERDSWKSNNFVRLFKMIEDGTPASTLVKAPRIRDDYDITVVDEKVNSILNGTGYDGIPEADVLKFKRQSRVKYVDTGTTDPKVLIGTKYLRDFIGYLLKDDPDERMFFYEWPMNSNSPREISSIPVPMGPPNDRGDDWRSFVGVNSGAQYNDEANGKDFFEYVAHIELLEGGFGTSSNPSDPRTRFRYVPLDTLEVDPSGDPILKYVLFDSEIGIIPIRYDDEIRFKSHVSYVPNSGVQEYVAGQFSFSPIGMLSPNPDFPITGVRLDPKGYGGSINNPSWDSEQPWDLDFEAFDEWIVKNVNGDLVYMIGSDGSKLISNYGLDYLDTDGNVPVRYGDIVHDDQSVTFWDEDDEYSEGWDFHVYRRPAPKYEIWTPRSEVMFDPGYRIRIGSSAGSIERVTHDGQIISDPSDIVMIGDDIYYNPTSEPAPPTPPSQYLVSDCVYLFRDDFEDDFFRKDSLGVNEYSVKFYDDEGTELTDLILLNTNSERYHRATNKPGETGSKYVNPDTYVFALKIPSDPDDLYLKYPFINDRFRMVVIDSFGLKVERVFEAGIGKLRARMMESRPVVYYGDVLYSMSAVTDLWFDPRTLNSSQRFVTNDQSSVVMRGSVFNPSGTWGNEFSDTIFRSGLGPPLIQTTVNSIRNATAGWNVSINFNEKPNVKFFNTISGPDNIEILSNFRTIDRIDLCIERDWCSDTELLPTADLIEKYLKPSVWSGDRRLDEIKIFNGIEDVTMEMGWNFNVDVQPSQTRLVADHMNSIGLVRGVRILEGPINVPSFDMNVFRRGEETVLLHPGTEDIKLLVKGLRTHMLFRKPAYQNFKELLTMKRQVISLDRDPIVQRTGNSDFNRITEMDPKRRFFSLDLPLPDESLNDGEKHEVEIKILTTDTQQTIPEFMNHPDHIVEVNLVEVDKFGYDRIFFDPEGYPQPPVKLEGRYYNLKFSSMYENEDVVFKNSNGFKVYQCDETGRYLRWVLQGGQPSMRILGNEVGDCRSDVFGAIDRRHNPRRPMFNSSYEWFLSQFHVEGQEKNPFWQTLEVRDFYDDKIKIWTQKIYTKRWEKAVDKMVEVIVPEDQQYCFIENGIIYEFDSGSIKSVISDYINYEDGFINFILGFPAKTYYTDKYLIKYGLYVKNQFYPGEKNKQVWNSWVKMKFQEAYDFIVNSTENIANPGDRDLAIVPVREMGLFDRYHRLVAYATFPDVEYRSDKQHISFTMVIRNSSFVVSGLMGTSLETTIEDLNG